MSVCLFMRRDRIPSCGLTCAVRLHTDTDSAAVAVDGGGWRRDRRDGLENTDERKMPTQEQQRERERGRLRT